MVTAVSTLFFPRLTDVKQSPDGDGRGTSGKVVDGSFRQLYFGRLARPLFTELHVYHRLNATQIAEGSARHLIQMFDVKRRAYFGNTSMEAEISLIMANQALVRCHISQRKSHESQYFDQAAPNKFIYDPFVGTGSTTYASFQLIVFLSGNTHRPDSPQLILVPLYLVPTSMAAKCEEKA